MWPSKGVGYSDRKGSGLDGLPQCTSGLSLLTDDARLLVIFSATTLVTSVASFAAVSEVDLKGSHD